MAAPDLYPNTRIENRPRRGVNTLTKIGAVVTAGLIAGGIIDTSRSHGYVRQPEVVRSFDTPWAVVNRAEKDAGINPDSVDMRPAVDRMVAQYGDVLHPGEKVVAKLDK